MKLVWLSLGLAALFTLPLFIFGNQLDEWLEGDQAVQWLREFGPWAAVVAAGLLVGDLVAPVPQSPVLAALGVIYGPIVGTLVGAAGVFTAGMLAYLIARYFGPAGAKRLVGEDELKRLQHFFHHAGPWAVALTRPIPTLPEVICCLAGLSGMPSRRFIWALALGSLPTAAAFAILGHYTRNSPALATGIAIAVSLVLLPLALWLTHRSERRSDQQSKPPAADNPDAAST